MNRTEYSFSPEDFEFVPKDNLLPPEEIYNTQSYFKDIRKRFTANKGAVAGGISILLILLLAIIGPMLSGHTYYSQNITHQNLAPRIKLLEGIGIFDGSETITTSTGTIEQNKYISEDTSITTGLEEVYYWFGTDVLGRDIFTRTWEGTRISLYIAFVAVMVDMCFGMIYGLISGYFGGRTDMIMQRFAEILNGIPTLVIVTLLILVFQPGLLTITIALAITGWIGMSRIARAQVLKLKEQEFILASKTLGAKDFFIIFKEILPNIFGQLIVMSMFSIPNAIFTEAFLAFIGLGVPQPLASLGSLISDAFKSFTTHPYMIVFPVIVLGIIMLSFNLMADGLRDAFDPKMKEI
ncbi:peptide ABC transporter permease [Anaerocolumna cellulosilytica]|uniref:Peptide ABC transporter permease n=1 Tax=Anaerocolumna cellulosilytica TaxID=433286 RepID=A0A6S6QMF3_9FIRM|nr:ABC transporter permease [Anaerocolumna cellulosilytica]MBB5196158.1 oligopeptide transport system permease protein [Anaerocolumna cellulosilytica]BCJ92523.1 peptide ABC transporter permease [Anaerocolumna cellulosilytica]